MYLLILQQSCILTASYPQHPNVTQIVLDPSIIDKLMFLKSQVSKNYLLLFLPPIGGQRLPSPAPIVALLNIKTRTQLHACGLDSSLCLRQGVLVGMPFSKLGHPKAWTYNRLGQKAYLCISLHSPCTIHLFMQSLRPFLNWTTEAVLLGLWFAHEVQVSTSPHDKSLCTTWIFYVGLI